MKIAIATDAWHSHLSGVVTTRFGEYIEMRSFVPGRIVFRLLKWFHAASS